MGKKLWFNKILIKSKALALTDRDGPLRTQLSKGLKRKSVIYLWEGVKYC